MNKGDFHADGDTILLFLPGVSSNLELDGYKREKKEILLGYQTVTKKKIYGLNELYRYSKRNNRADLLSS